MDCELHKVTTETFGGGFKAAGHSSLLKFLEPVTELIYAPVYLHLHLTSLGIWQS